MLIASASMLRQPRPAAAVTPAVAVP
jgi:hypothetical protein